MTAHVTPKKMKTLCITCIVFASLYAIVTVLFLLLGSFCSSEVSGNMYQVGYFDALFDRGGFVECAKALTGWDGVSVHLVMLCALLAMLAGVAFNMLTIVLATLYLSTKSKVFYDITLPLSSSGSYLCMMPILVIAAVQTVCHITAVLNKSASILAALISPSQIILWIFLASPLFITMLYAIITGIMKKIKQKEPSRKERKESKKAAKLAKKNAKAENA